LHPRRISSKKKDVSIQKESRIFWKFWTVAVILLLAWIAASPYGVWKYRKLQREKATVYAQYVKMMKENEALKQYAARFQDDREFQERVIRKELGWVRDDELLYKFVN